MYNAKVKDRFLEEANVIDSTRKYYRYILETASRTEEALDNGNGKDIYEMTPYECDQLILSYPRKSEEVLFVVISVLKKYVDFCEEINLTKDYNYFATISGTNDVRKYLDMNAIEFKYITLDDLIEMQSHCINPQDAVSVELPFIGLRGDRSDEILELRVDQVFPNPMCKEEGSISEEHKIVLSDREIPITFRTWEVIRDAVTQEDYLRGNGDTEAKAQSMSINRTDYVLRVAGSTKGGSVNYSSYIMRIGRIKKYFGNPYINVTNIWYSGMIHQLKEIKKENGNLKKEDYQRICGIFGLGVDKWHILKKKFELYI